MTSALMAGAGIVALFAGSVGTRWLVHWWHQPDPGRRAAGTVVAEQHHEQDFYGSMTLAEERLADYDPAAEPFYWLPADPVPWEDSQSDARIEDRDGDETAAWFHSLGEEEYMREHHPAAFMVVGPPDPGPGVVVPSHGCSAPGPVQAVPWSGAGREGAGTQTECLAYEPAPGHAEPSRLATAADVDAARPWLDVQREWLDGQYGEFYAWLLGVMAA